MMMDAYPISDDALASPMKTPSGCACVCVTASSSSGMKNKKEK